MVRTGGGFIKKLSLITGIGIMLLVAAFTYLPVKQNVRSVPPEPDFGKVKPLVIEEVTISQSGKTKVYNRNEKDFQQLADALREPVCYSGLFDRLKDGRNVFRLPSLYVPPVEDIINGKVPEHENAIVISVKLAAPIDMTFANHIADLPNLFTTLIFLPYDTEYQKVVIFANSTTSYLTIPSKRYNSEIFKDFI